SGCASDRRQPVGKTRSKTTPEADPLANSIFAEGAAPRPLDHLERVVVDAHIAAAELEYAGQAKPVSERSRGNPRLLKEDRPLRLRIGARVVDVVALTSLQPQTQTDRTRDIGRPDARREDEGVGSHIPARRRGMGHRGTRCP